MQAVILAAGQGKRLRPLTNTRSKGMLSILGKPIVARIIDTFYEIGIDDFILVIDPKDEYSSKYFSSNDFLRSKDISVKVVYQYEKLGMAHALMMAAPFINAPFILTACDNLVPVADVFKLKKELEKGVSGVLVLIEVLGEKISSISAVDFDGEKVHRIIEKPKPEEAYSNIASISLYGFSVDILKYLPKVVLSKRGEYELQDAIQLLIQNKGLITGFLIDSRLSLTNVENYLDINQIYLSNLTGEGVHFESNLPENVKIFPPVWIDSNVVIGEGCAIGPNVYLESGCQIGDQAILRDVVVIKGAVVQNGAVLNGQVVI